MPRDEVYTALMLDMHLEKTESTLHYRYNDFGYPCKKGNGLYVTEYLDIISRAARARENHFQYWVP